MGDYEEDQTPDGKNRKIHYLSGGNGLAAIYIEEDGNGQLYHAYTDYLGSLTALTDKDGKEEERQAFDPWGNRREPNDWTSLITTPVSHITRRGYTMHEHLDGFSLINMNGRVYDPQIARFLSPDPQLQAPGYWLNYNRYGYCYNNPMIYTDPSGEWIVSSLVALGITYLASAHENRNRETGRWEWNPGNWNTPIVFGLSTNSNGSNFNAGASVGGQLVFSTGAVANSGNGNNGTVSLANFGNGAEFYSNLSPAGALRDMTVFPSLRLNYQMHGLDVDMRTGSLMFNDRSTAYDYMWNKSFNNEFGNFGPAREVSGWELKGGGTIVMPYYKNLPRKCFNSYQNSRGNSAGLEVEFNGQYYPVETHVHTHPMYNSGNIGLSGSPQKIEGDYQLLYDLDLDYINVIYNNKIHKAYYDFYNKQWDFLNVWTW